MHRLVFSLLLSSSLLGLQAFAMDDDKSPAAGGPATWSPKLKNPAAGQPPRSTSAIPQEDDLKRATSRSGQESREAKMDTIREKLNIKGEFTLNPTSEEILNSISVADMERGSAAGMNLFDRGYTDEKIRLLFKLSTLPENKLYTIVAAAPAVMPNFYDQRELQDFISKMEVLSPETITVVEKEAYNLFSDEMSYSDRASILNSLATLPPEISPAFATLASKLFTFDNSDVTSADKVKIIKALESLPHDTIPEVAKNVDDIFNARMDARGISNIINGLGTLPRDVIPVVAQNASALFTKEGGDYSRTSIIQGLKKLPEETIPVVAQNASKLFKFDRTAVAFGKKIVRTYDVGVKILDILSTLPQDVISAVAQNASPLTSVTVEEKTLKALADLPEGTMRVVAENASDLISQSESGGTEVIKHLKGLGPITIRTIAENASRFFHSKMMNPDRVEILEAFSTLPSWKRPVVAENATQLFTDNMDSIERSAIIKALGELPKETIPAVAQNKGNLFTDNMSSLTITNIIDALADYSEDTDKIFLAVQKASNLYNENIGPDDRARLISLLLYHPLENATALVENASKLPTDYIDRYMVMQGLLTMEDPEKIPTVLEYASQLFTAEQNATTKRSIVNYLDSRIRDNTGVINYTTITMPAVVAKVKEKVTASGDSSKVTAYISEAVDELVKGATLTESDTTLTESDTPATTTASRPAGLPAEWTWQGYLGQNPGLANMFGRAGNKDRIDAADSDKAKDAIKEQILQEHFLKWGQTSGLKYQDEPVSRPQGLPTGWTWQGYLGQNPGLANMFGRAGNKDRIDAADSDKAKDAIKEQILQEHFLKWGQTSGLNY